MITLTDDGEIKCTYNTCSREFCEGEICYAGIYQCSHIEERAKVYLPDAIEEFEEFKQIHQNEIHDDEYYMDLSMLRERVDTYTRLANGEKINQ